MPHGGLKADGFPRLRLKPHHHSSKQLKSVRRLIVRKSNKNSMLRLIFGRNSGIIGVGKEDSMATEPLTKVDVAAPVFPAAEVKRRLQVELQKIADQGSVLRPEWEPLLDSKRVVGTVLVIEDLFPFKIPPDKVVRKGGYNSVDEAVDDVLGRIERLAAERSKPKVRK